MSTTDFYHNHAWPVQSQTCISKPCSSSSRFGYDQFGWLKLQKTKKIAKISKNDYGKLIILFDPFLFFLLPAGL